VSSSPREQPLNERDFVPVTGAVSQRLFLLAGIALLAAVVAVAFVERHTGEAASAVTFSSVPVSGGWNRAFAGSRGPTGDAQRTSCGQLLTPKSLGVTDPALPCGAKIVLRYGGTQVLTEVIDNVLAQPDRDLEVTPALARMLGLEGAAQIEWRFASGGSG
jgi:hypothetical protein